MNEAHYAQLLRLCWPEIVVVATPLAVVVEVNEPQAVEPQVTDQVAPPDT